MEKQTLRFSGEISTQKNKGNGLDELCARMIVVREGHEAEANSISRAFKASAQNCRIKGQFAIYNKQQLEKRIAELQEMPEHADTVHQLKHAHEAVITHKATMEARGNNQSNNSARMGSTYVARPAVFSQS